MMHASAWRVSGTYFEACNCEAICPCRRQGHEADHRLNVRSSDEQFAALTEIFLGRAGGTTFRNLAGRICVTYVVRRAAVELDHRPRRWFMRASKWLEVRATQIVPSELPVSCGIPGHDRPGNELIVDTFRVQDAPLDFDLRGRCGFETDFNYSSQNGV